MEIKDTIKISKDFSDAPGARKTVDGEASGQAFLKILEPKFKKAVKEGYLLLVDLEDLIGFPSSFISSSFGRLSLDNGADLVLKHLRFKSDDNPLRSEKTIRQIKDPKKKLV